MTRFNMFTNEELDAMESAFCNEGLTFLVEEIRRERRYREAVVEAYNEWIVKDRLSTFNTDSATAYKN